MNIPPLNKIELSEVPVREFELVNRRMIKFRHTKGVLICGFIGLLLLVSPAIAASFFDEWRYPNGDDIIGDWEIFRENGNEVYTTAGDFNGDGVPDEAWILIKKDNSEWGLFVFLHAEIGPPKIIELDRIKTTDMIPQGMDVWMTPPGFYLSSCARGIGSGCEPGERRSIDLKYPAVAFFRFESHGVYFFWNEETNGFEIFY